MEGNDLPTGNMLQGALCGTLDLHGNSMKKHARNSGKQIFSSSQVLGTFKMSMNRATNPDDFLGFQFKQHGKSDDHHHQHSHNLKNNMSDGEEHDDMTEDAIDTPSGKGNKGFTWHRIKWTDSMVKLLITTMCYTGDDHDSDFDGGERNFTIMQKKGKWKAISKVMGERGCHVSPQQCEDKFNDLNKRYKRLTDILGRGTACNVVANPTLLDSMNNLSDKMKDDAKKILNSKHLFYEEMCSYHDNNCVSSPKDHTLQHSLLLLALRSKEEHDPQRGSSEDADEDDQSAYSNYEENDEEQHHVHPKMRESFTYKRTRYGDVGLGTSSSYQGSERSNPHGAIVDINKALKDETNLVLLQHDLYSQGLEIQKHRLQIEVKELELTKQRLKWERFKKKKDMEIKRMSLENEHMMIENKRLELELRHNELELKLKLKGQGNQP